MGQFGGAIGGGALAGGLMFGPAGILIGAAVGYFGGIVAGSVINKDFDEKTDQLNNEKEEYLKNKEKKITEIFKSFRAKNRQEKAASGIAGGFSDAPKRLHY